MTDDTPDVASQELDTQLRRLQTITDPVARSVATDLISSLLQFHSAALEKLLDIVAEKSGNADAIFAELDGDPLTRSLLLLHDLHPEPFDSRVVRAVQELQSRLQKRGATLEVVRIEEGVVRVRVTAKNDGRGPLGPAVEEALHNAVPDAAQVIVDEPGVKSGFVPLQELQPAALADSAATQK